MSTSNTSYFNCPNCNCTEIIVIRLQCHCHTGNTPTIQDNHSYSHNPIIHPGVNTETPRAISTAIISQNPYSYNQINHLVENSCPTHVTSPGQHRNQGRQHIPEYNPGYGFIQTNTGSSDTNIVPSYDIHCVQNISIAQHENHGFNPDHGQQHPIPEYNLGYRFVQHDIASSNTGITTAPTNNTSPETVQGSSSCVHAQYTSTPCVYQLADVEANYGEGPSPSC